MNDQRTRLLTLHTDLRCFNVAKEREWVQRAIAKARTEGILTDASDDTLERFAKIANSCAQGQKSRNGSLLEKLVAEYFRAALPAWVEVEPKWRNPRYRHRPVDLVISYEGHRWFISIKASTRERAEHTWTEERRATKLYCDRHGLAGGYRFIAITGEDKITPSLRDKLPSTIEYGTAQSFDFMSRITEEILEVAGW